MAMLNIKLGKTESLNGKGKKLTPKMMSFIDAYFSDAMFNATTAYDLSLYSSVDRKDSAIKAARLMLHPLVEAEVKRRFAVKTEKSEVKAEYLINKLMSIIEATEVDNPTAALRGIELLGKSIAFWKERQEISGPDGQAIQHEQRVKESVANFTKKLEQLSTKVDYTVAENIIPIRSKI